MFKLQNHVVSIVSRHIKTPLFTGVETVVGLRDLDPLLAGAGKLCEQKAWMNPAKTALDVQPVVIR